MVSCQRSSRINPCPDPIPSSQSAQPLNVKEQSAASANDMSVHIEQVTFRGSDNAVWTLVSLDATDAPGDDQAGKAARHAHAQAMVALQKMSAQ
jgi:hypothetical protein